MKISGIDRMNTVVILAVAAVVAAAAATTVVQAGSSSQCSSFLSPSYQQKYGNTPFAVPFRSVVVFGDSYSDVGNIYDESNGAQPAPERSWKGRYADGPVWNEYVAHNYFNLVENDISNADNNFAWGGATTNNSYIPAFSTSLNQSIPAVNEQIQDYVERQQQSVVGTNNNDDIIDDDVLHVLWSGYNDYWWYAYRNYTTAESSEDSENDVGTTTGESSTDYRPTNAELERVAANVARFMLNNVRTLYDHGATQFLVMNMFNMSMAPEALTVAATVRESYDLLVQYHNDYLHQYLDDFIHDVNNNNKKKNDQDPSSSTVIVYQPNAYTAFDCIATNSISLGLYNTKDTYYGGSSNPDTEGDAIFTYEWWDSYHPTTHTHQLIATQTIQTIFDYHHQKKDTKHTKHAKVSKKSKKSSKKNHQKLEQ